MKYVCDEGKMNEFFLCSEADPKRNPLNNCGILRAEIIAIALHFLFLFAFSTLYLC